MMTVKAEVKRVVLYPIKKLKDYAPGNGSGMFKV